MSRDSIRGPGPEIFTLSRLESGRIRICSKSHGSGRVRRVSNITSGQAMFEISRVRFGRVGSGWVGGVSNLTGRIESL